MNKYKTLALNTLVFAIGSFGSKVLSFLLTKLYTANFERALFNTKEILEMTANFLIPVVSFSITDAIIRYGLDKNYEKRAVFSNAVAVLLAGAGGFILLSPFMLLFDDVRGYVPLLVGYIIISCFRQISTQFARARGFVKLYALDGICCTFTLFIFNVIFISWMGLGVKGFLLSVMFSDLCSGAFVWWIARHGRFFSFRFIDRELMEVMLRFSIPLIPAALLWIITGFSDRIFLKHLVSADDAGLYGAATKIPNLISMVSTVFYQAWNMSAIAENDSRERNAFYTKVYEAYQAMLYLAAGCIILLDIPLSRLLIDTSKDPGYVGAFLYTPALVIAVLLMCLNQFFASIYTVTKHTKNSLWTSLVAAVLNLFLNAVLISEYGINGAVIATVLSYLVCYFVRLIDARRFVPFRVYHWRFIINIGILFLMSWFMHNPALNQSGTPFRTHLIAYSGCLLGLAAITVINAKPLLNTVRKVLRRR